ncbi:MAG: 3-dehydroquinate synthase [Desulfuromonadales bacterium]
MSKENIILTGFMGTGKTTVGRLMAEQLNYEFIDTDQYIEEQIGCTIAEFFREKGEAAFRQMEADLAQSLAHRTGLVISTGGRMMLDPNNAAALSKTGRVFCLVATPEEILQRVSNDGNVRPLLQVPNPLEHIVELMQQREKGYKRFSQLETSAKLPVAIASDLAEFVQGKRDLRLEISAPSIDYEFIVGSGILPFVTSLAKIDGPVAIITDESVAPLYAQSCGVIDTVIVVPPGRQHKTLATAQSVCEQLLDADFDRSGTIIALGGTVISELAGFVAATYMRGVDCVQCPTSLLAMVDTSIGGKAGVDLPQGKNLIGAFKQPKTVIADVATLQSLPPRAFASGMAEVIKHSLIADSDLLQKIETGNWIRAAGELQQQASELQALVAQAIQVKINIIQEDPYEQGRRAVLNFGHTFANAIERLSRHEVRHGEAVAMGMVAATQLSSALGFCAADLQQRLESVLLASGLPIRIPAALHPEQLFQAMSSDKKKKAGKLRFVLIRGIGDVFVTDQIPEHAILTSLSALRS